MKTRTGHFDEKTASRRGFARAAAVLALMAVLAFLVTGCPPGRQLYGAGVSGTILSQNSQAASLATVYLLDNATLQPVPSTLSRTNQGGHFHLDGPAGDFTLVATDGAGSAAFVYVTLVTGSVIDIGAIGLEACAPGDVSPNSDLYEPCPAGAAVTPPPSYDVPFFSPDRVDAQLYTSTDPSAGNAVFVDASDDIQLLDVTIGLPAGAAAYSSGSYTVTADASGNNSSDLFVTLQITDPAKGYGNYYVLASGNVDVETFEPVDGGTFNATLSNAVFEWVDPSTGFLDAGHTITIDDTSPNISGTFHAADSGMSNGGIGGETPAPTPTPAAPPPSVSAQGTIAASNIFLSPMAPNGVHVVGLFTTADGSYLSLDIPVTAAFDTAGTFSITNTLTGNPATWALQLFARADLVNPNGGDFYGYALASGTWHVTQSAHAIGEAFSATLTNATFVYLDPSTGMANPSITLTIGDSGTLSGTLLDPNPPAGGNVGEPWTIVYVNKTF